MHFVTTGCGRVGATLAKGVIAHGHSLTMVDNNPNSFRKLPKDFEGQEVTDEDYDHDTQRQVDAEDAYGFATVAGDDNASILAAQIAREVYGVKKAMTRITDPRRAEVYEQLGIPIMDTVNRTVQSLLSRILPLDSETVFTEDINKLVLCRALLETSWMGRTVAKIQQVLGVRAVYVSRFSWVALVSKDTILQENDELYFFVTASKRPAVASRLARVFRGD